MNDSLVLVRKSALTDLVGTAHAAADVLADRGATPQELAIADALRGGAAQVMADAVLEPA